MYRGGAGSAAPAHRPAPVDAFDADEHDEFEWFSAGTRVFRIKYLFKRLPPLLHQCELPGQLGGKRKLLFFVFCSLILKLFVYIYFSLFAIKTVWPSFLPHIVRCNNGLSESVASLKMCHVR